MADIDRPRSPKAGEFPREAVIDASRAAAGRLTALCRFFTFNRE